jgi:hypothetical protein
MDLDRGRGAAGGGGGAKRRRAVGPQLIARVNGAVVLTHEAQAVAELKRALAGRVPMGNDARGAAPFVGRLDEARAAKAGPLTFVDGRRGRGLRVGAGHAAPAYAGTAINMRRGSVAFWMPPPAGTTAIASRARSRCSWCRCCCSCSVRGRTGGGCAGGSLVQSASKRSTCAGSAGRGRRSWSRRRRAWFLLSRASDFRVPRSASARLPLMRGR